MPTYVIKTVGARLNIRITRFAGHLSLGRALWVGGAQSNESMDENYGNYSYHEFSARASELEMAVFHYGGNLVDHA